MAKRTFLLILLISCISGIKGQVSDSTERSSLRLAGFPVLGYAPETRLIGGVYGHILAGDPLAARPSSLGLSALVSQNRQFSLNVFPELWMKKNLYRLAGELKWQYWPDKFYGIGNDTKKENRESYVARVSGIKLDFMRSVHKSLYAGILLEVENNDIIEYDTVSYAQLPGGSIPGSDQSLISGLGLGAAWDSRDNILLPQSGVYLQFRVVWFNSFMGSTFPHSKWILDLRKYSELGREHLIYFQLYGKFLIGQEIPFRNMALLGGDKLLRGYFRGRYRDHNMIVAQAEYHSPPVWRFSLVVFAGAGEVFNATAEESNFYLKPAGGIGLRYRVFKDRRMNIRLDAATGRGDRGIYLGILEAF